MVKQRIMLLTIYKLPNRKSKESKAGAGKHLSIWIIEGITIFQSLFLAYRFDKLMCKRYGCYITYLQQMVKAILFSAMIFSATALEAQEYYMITGTYTGGRSRGIYVHAFNTKDGSARLVDSAVTVNPSYLVLSADNKFLYAVNEEGKRDGGGKVTSFSFEQKTGKLKELNRQPSMGDNPCYISLDQTGKWVAVANYSSGSAAVYAVKADGSLGEPSWVTQHKGSGPNKDRQEGPHVHATVFSPDNDFLFLSDLGTDELVCYAFDDKTGKGVKSEDRTIKTEKGSGPRHFEFHPNQKWLYLLHELSGDIAVYDYENGKMNLLQTVNSLPENFHENFTSADIHVSPDGKFLYASNRDQANSIVIFRIDEKSGKLELVGYQSALGKTPRNFSFDPSGNFLLVANQNSDNIVVFAIDKETGLLKDTGNRVEVGNPVCIKWAGR
jgi:6-phosphogluconolactonase